MKITFSERKSTSIEQLEIGDVFNFQGGYYLIIDYNGSKISGTDESHIHLIALISYKLCYMSKNTEVIICRADLEITKL